MIKTQGLSKTFLIGKKHDTALKAVDELTLEVHEGEVFGFLGPNGAGKTTTVRMLTSLIRPTSGSAIVAGYQVGKDDIDIRRNVGLLTESPGMYERLSAEKNLRIFAELYDVPDVNKAVSKYLSLFGLWERRADAVGSFSKGMRQKLAVARALVHEPKVLFFDEPTTGLDPEAARIVRDFILEFKQEGRTIFMTTHNLDEAEKLCDRVGIFKQSLLALDSPANLRQKMFGRKVVFHLGGVDPQWAALIEEVEGVSGVELLEDKIVVSMTEPETSNPLITRLLVEQGADIRFIGEVRQSLEKIYLEMLHGNETRQA
ncbi:MAG TPA: ABC transporter ATP-binding protein [Anaerolineaceae bacterium]|mgnify:CR=1 FL=1|jgi:ABC-2 type transport system ATP-binding protein|nr:ABC transporter ATP-binding protein [Chloroflexota bacterium]HOF28140.1 ABC transporter ATP-binding protein [Anaerolineaceae bacterium]